MAAWLLAVVVVTMLWQAGPAAAQSGGTSTATYDVTFEGMWTTASTPGGVVGSAHFTTLVGAAHNDRVTFWRSGERATPGVEETAETGGTSAFQAELRASPHAGDVILQGIAFGGTGTANFSVQVTTERPLLTLISMIGPSPDWFVGISGRSLRNADGTWKSRDVVDLFPYDAGTEDGTEFTLSNEPTVPQGVIHSIRGMGKFSNEPMARLTFVLRSQMGGGDGNDDDDDDETPVPALPLAGPLLLALLLMAGAARTLGGRR